MININTQNLNINIDADLFQQLDSFKRFKKYKSESEAMEELLRMAFQSFKEKQEEAEDEYLFALALEREKNGSGVTYTHEEFWAEFGITDDEIDGTEDVELEYELPD